MSDDRSWLTDEYPELRDGPPWVMEEMILSEPELPAAILDGDRSAADAIGGAVRDAAARGEPIVVTGCGTSEHGAMAVAGLIAAELPDARVEARQAVDAAVTPRSGGVCLAISHDGGTPCTRRSLEAARAAGATTACVTWAADGSVAAASVVVMPTPVHDVSWCHTVAYVSAIVAGCAIARSGVDSARLGAAAHAAIDARPALAEAAGRIHPGRRILTTGLGADHVSARELALKIEEGARIPATAHHLETLLHGHLAGCDAGTTAVVRFGLDESAAELRGRRQADVDAALRAIGIPEVAVDGSLGLPRCPTTAEALVAGAVALQLLTLELAHLAGTNPDLIRREQQPYRDAAAAAEASGF